MKLKWFSLNLIDLALTPTEFLGETLIKSFFFLSIFTKLGGETEKIATRKIPYC